MAKPDKIHMTTMTFKTYMDNMTLWQRRAILLRFELEHLGYGEIAARVMELDKEACARELIKWQESNSD